MKKQCYYAHASPVEIPYDHSERIISVVINSIYCVMNRINVKIQFDTNLEVLKLPKILLWDNYEEKVRADINRGKGGSYVVYLKYPMPRREMDNIILELCDRVVWDGFSPISYGSIDRKYTFSGIPNNEEIITNAIYQFLV